MPSEKEEFLGHTYETDSETSLKVGDQEIAVEKHENGELFTERMPYGTFKSLTDMAKSIITNAAEFDTTSKSE
jgi:hypothetical protein